MLGHATASMTVDLYGHLVDANLWQAARLVGDIELLSRPVDQDLLGGFGLGILAGSFDELAVDEGGSGADQGDEMRRVDGAPAVLG